jgi:hypothetical protein
LTPWLLQIIMQADDVPRNPFIILPTIIVKAVPEQLPRVGVSARNNLNASSWSVLRQPVLRSERRTVVVVDDPIYDGGYGISAQILPTN